MTEKEIPTSEMAATTLAETPSSSSSSAIWSQFSKRVPIKNIISRPDGGVGLAGERIKGSMMAPHVNPTATEYGVVLSGAGTIQVVFPNGTLAMNTRVQEGDVFWVPRYFPFCQIASRSGPMEFFGFTTSARENRPQFLAGASSILQTMSGPELAMSFGVSEKRLKSLINAQRESIILPSAPVSETDKLTKERSNGMGSLTKKHWVSEMIMGFD